MLLIIDAFKILRILYIVIIVILLFEELVLEGRVLLWTIIIVEEIVEWVRMFKLFFLANYFAFFILFISQILILIACTTTARSCIFEVYNMVIFWRGYVTAVAQFILLVALDFQNAIIFRDYFDFLREIFLLFAILIIVNMMKMMIMGWF